MMMAAQDALYVLLSVGDIRIVPKTMAKMNVIDDILGNYLDRNS